MANIQSHSGGCCGRRCVSNFSSSFRQGYVDNARCTPEVRGTRRGKCLEIVLTSRQLTGNNGVLMGEWLARNHYEHVYSFANSTGGICHVFLGSTFGGARKKMYVGSRRTRGLAAFKDAKIAMANND